MIKASAMEWKKVCLNKDSWAVLKLLTSVHLGKIVDLHKNDKSYNIFINFFMEKHKILPQFDDLTS